MLIGIAQGWPGYVGLLLRFQVNAVPYGFCFDELIKKLYILATKLPKIAATGTKSQAHQHQMQSSHPACPACRAYPACAACPQCPACPACMSFIDRDDAYVRHVCNKIIFQLHFRVFVCGPSLVL